ncbi:MAG: ParB/RepB/Spo0J family partition protein, partial [Butyrivibrio sp.]|nr:ParB/RepB/Spo0J family partition protein [Butyrivibrio sp.]
MEQKKRKSDFRLPSVDDLFTTQEMRDVESMTSGHILDIPISEIDDFPEHPFIVRDDEEMEALMASIKVHGVIEPVTVRKKDDGRYEMISGHRRKHASSRLGLDTIRCEVVELTREEAILQMVESNLHREHILPSEKAFAYKMRLEAMKRQAGRPSKDNLVPVGQNFSREELATQSGESQTQIQRYIRLTNLIPEILEFVDNSVLKIRGKLQIALRPAVELSYLSEEEQTFLLELMNCHDCTPSHAQAIRMRRMSEEGSL